MTKRKEILVSDAVELEPLETQEAPIDTTSKDERPEPVIYIGDSLKNGKLEQFTVFNNGIPDFLAEDIEKCPAIQSLILPISQLGECRQKLSIQGSLEDTLNNQIIQYVRSEK
ncbi:hypothetical protein [Peribacillus muralis]|uniref:hypothetical protein n=1 Tax=Peribacillus muralis TaxID=264697 RepID=UPI003D07DF76